MICLSQNEESCCWSEENFTIPPGFEKKEVKDDGHCFYHSVLKGIRQLKIPGITGITIESLKQTCYNSIVDDETRWREIIEDDKNGGYKGFLHYKRIFLKEKLWGRPHIEGRMICEKYNIVIHLIEFHKSRGLYLHKNIFPSNEYKPEEYRENTIYNVNRQVIHIYYNGINHFDPIVRKSEELQNVAPPDKLQSSTSRSQNLNRENKKISHKIYESDDHKVKTEKAEISLKKRNLETNLSDDNEIKKRIKTYLSDAVDEYKTVPPLNSHLGPSQNNKSCFWSEKFFTIPPGFKIKEVKGDGLCFYHSVLKGIRQLNIPGLTGITIESLKQTCYNSIVDDETRWREIIEDDKNGGYKGFLHYKRIFLKEKLWGRPHIEGRMICEKFNIVIHLIEFHKTSTSYFHENIFPSNEYKPEEYRENTIYNVNRRVIHIINKGNNHFEPIVRINSSQNVTPPDRLQSTTSRSQNLNRENEKISNKIYQSDDHKVNTEKTEISLLDADTYTAGGLQNCLHGILYQVMLLIKSFNHCRLQGYNFQLGTEMDNAEKFDDLVLHFKKEKISYSIFSQAKHTQMENENNKKICESDLKADKKGNYSLKKYFYSYQKIKLNSIYRKNSYFVINTNIGINFEKNSKKMGDFYFKSFEAPEVIDLIKYGDGNCYQLETSDRQIATLKALFESDMKMLAQELSKHLVDNKAIGTKSQIFQTYHTALAKEIIDIKTERLAEKFSKNDSNLTTFGKIFYKTLFKAVQNELMKNPKLTNLCMTQLLSLFCTAKTGITNIIDEKKHAAVISEMYKLSDHVLNVDTIITFNKKFFYMKNKQRKDLDTLKSKLNEQMRKEKSQKLINCTFLIKNFQTNAMEEQQYKEAKKILDKKLELTADFKKVMVFQENPQINDEIVDLILKAKDYKISINQNNKTNKKYIPEIYKLEGHVLVKGDDAKIHQRQEFKFSKCFLDGTKLPSNILKFRSKLEEQLNANKKDFNDLEKYTFKISGFQSCENNKFSELLATEPEYPEEFVSDEDIKHFINDLVFATDQPNEATLYETISANMISEFNIKNTESITNDLMKEMFDWLKIKHNTMKTEADANLFYFKQHQKLALHNMSGITSDKKKKLKLYGLSFNKIPEQLINFVNFNLSVQHRICVLETPETLPTCIKVYQALENRYDDHFIFVDSKTYLSDAKKVKNAFMNNQTSLLIIEFTPQDDDKLLGFFSTECNELSNILENTKDKRLLLIILPNHVLVKNFEQKFLKIEDQTLFSELSSESKQKFLENKVTFQGYEIALNQLFDDQKDADNKEPVEKNQVVNNDQPVDTKDHIISLITITALLENSIKVIGNKVLINNSYNKNYYIDRNFQTITKYSKRTSDLILTQDLLNQLKMGKHKEFILISNTAGMGKSTVLTHLSLEIKKANPHFWVVRIDLNANTEALKKHKKKLTFDNVVEFIVDELLKVETELEKELFKHLLKERKVVLMLDAFDEIRPSYEKKGIELVKSLKKISLRQLWITTRPYLKNEPKASLDELFSGDQVDSLAITPFSQENQKEFLQKFWNQTDKFNQWDLNDYACNLIRSLELSIEFNKEFTIIPLHLLMLAEVYEPDENLIKQTYLEIKIDLFFLYQKFFDKKIDIYLKKGATSDNNDASTEQKKDHKREINLWNAYEHSAIEFLFPEQTIDILKNIERESVSPVELTRSGIVVMKNGSISFVHRTFAEFFAVQFIMEELIRADPNEFLLDFLLTTILCKDEYAMIAKFLESFIEHSYQPNPKIKPFKNMGELNNEVFNEELKDKQSFPDFKFPAMRKNSFIIKFLSDKLNVESCKELPKSFTKCYLDGGMEGVNVLFIDDDHLDKAIDNLIARFNNFKYPIDQHPLLKLNDEGYNSWTFAIRFSHKYTLKKVWDSFRSNTKFFFFLKTELLLSKVNGEYLFFLVLSNVHPRMLKYIWQFAEEIGAQQELLQCKNKYGRTMMQLLLMKRFDRSEFAEILLMLLKMNISHQDKDNTEDDLEQLLWVKDNLSSLYLETDEDQTIFYHAAYNGLTKIVDTLWRIAKRILNKDELKNLLFETDEKGNNKAWLLKIFKCNDSPSEMALQFGADAGLENELYQKLLEIQNSAQGEFIYFLCD